MEKQRTPLAQAIETLTESANFITDNDSLQDRYYRTGLREAITELTELLPTEREAFEKAFERGGEEFSNAYKQTIYHGSNYFKKTFTQS